MTSAPDDGRGHRVDLPPWSWWVGPLAIAVAFASIIIVAVLVGAIVGAGEFSRLTTEFPQWTGILQDTVWIAVAVGLPLATYGYLRADQLGLGEHPDRRTLATSIIGLVVFFTFAAAYSAAVGLDADANDRLKDTGLGASIGSDLGYVLLYVVLAPVAEELLFRGVLFGSLRGRIGPWPAALLSGAIFGSIHLGGGQDPFIPVLAGLGVVLALAYHYSGALYAAVAIHAANNAISTGSSQPPAADWIYVLFVAGPLVAVALAWLLGDRIAAWAPSHPRGRRLT